MPVLATRRNYELVDLSGQNPEIGINALGLRKLVILPNYEPCNRKGILPQGVVATYSSEHTPNIEMLGDEVGGGFSLVKFDNPNENLEDIVLKIRQKLNKPAYLTENDFIVFYRFLSHDEELELDRDDLIALISAGADTSTKLLREIGFHSPNPETYTEAVSHGRGIRKYLTGLLQGIADGNVRSLLDLTHTSFERTESGVIYRRGAQKLERGDHGVVHWDITKNALLVIGKEQINETENSLPFEIQGSGAVDDTLPKIRKLVCISGVLKYLNHVSKN